MTGAGAEMTADGETGTAMMMTIGEIVAGHLPWIETTMVVVADRPASTIAT
jgi:hypothetical protein